MCLSCRVLLLNGINLYAKKRYRKCHKPEPVGMFYTIRYVNLFNQEQLAKKEMATSFTIYRLCVDGDMENMWFCVVVPEDYLGEYVCNVTDSAGETTVSKVVYLWCMY